MNPLLVNRIRIFLFSIYIVAVLFYLCVIWFLISRIIPASMLFVLYLLSIIGTALLTMRMWRRLFQNPNTIPCIEEFDLLDEEDQIAPSRYSDRTLHRLRLATMDRDFTGDDYESLLRLDDPEDLKFLRGASSTDISRLPCIQLPGSHPIQGATRCSDAFALSMMQKSCSICLDQYSQDDVIVTIPCFHQFHKDCITKWLLESATCPICEVHVF